MSEKLIFGVGLSLAAAYAAAAAFLPRIRPYWRGGARCGKLTCIAIAICCAAVATAAIVGQRLIGFVAVGVFLVGWITALAGLFQDVRSFREKKQTDLTKRWS
jgi:hypothetical protein